MFSYQDDSKGDPTVMGQTRRGHTQLTDVLLQEKGRGYFIVTCEPTASMLRVLE